MQRAYLTILGRSTWALINTYYAVLSERAYFPDLIYVFSEDIYADELEKAVNGMKILSREFDFEPKIRTEIVREADFIEAGIKINSTIKELKEKGYTVAVDITPGRKALVAGALLSADKLGVDHVFYLAVKSVESKPYMMKPLAVQKLRDFMVDVRSYRREE